ncbi:unnamed protein product [Sphagnum jensenii]
MLSNLSCTVECRITKTTQTFCMKDEKGALVEELKQEMALFIEELRTLDEYIPTLTDVCNHHVQDTQAEDSVRQEQFEKLNLDIEAVQHELRQI